MFFKKRPDGRLAYRGVFLKNKTTKLEFLGLTAPDYLINVGNIFFLPIFSTIAPLTAGNFLFLRTF